jgi:hypothetical protein
MFCHGDRHLSKDARKPLTLQGIHFYAIKRDEFPVRVGFVRRALFAT